MKRLNITSGSPSLLLRHPKDEEYVDGGYSKEFLDMLDSLDREDCGELAETGLLGKKRRLSSAQVSALERCFAAENKLEPERKARLAEELGLQPRQVAIWFQNRRARWKTKRLEKDYGVLKAEFGSLKLCFEELRLQNEALANKVREMKAKVCGGDQSDGESAESVKEESPGNNGGESDGLDHRRDEEDDDDTLITTTTIQGHGDIQPYGLSNSDRVHEGDLNFSLALNASSSSSSSSPSNALMASWFQVSSDSSRAVPAQNLSAMFGAHLDEPNCSHFFSVDQAPTLYWHVPEP